MTTVTAIIHIVIVKKCEPIIAAPSVAGNKIESTFSSGWQYRAVIPAETILKAESGQKENDTEPIGALKQIVKRILVQ